MVNGRVLNKLAMDHSSEQHHHVQWDTRQSEATVYYCLVAFYNRTFNYPWERGVPNKVSSDHGHPLATGRSLDNVSRIVGIQTEQSVAISISCSL